MDANIRLRVRLPIFIKLSFLLSSLNCGLNISLAHVPPNKPISMWNNNGVSHSGMGNFGATDYEAMQKLKVQCLPEDMAIYRQAVCKQISQKEEKEVSSLIESSASVFFNAGLRNYAANILSSEIKNMPGNSDFRPTYCINSGAPIKPSPHLDIRNQARIDLNAVSAAFIMDKRGSSSDNYEERLKRNYSYLFTPTEQWSDLFEIIEDGNDEVEGLGDQWDQSSFSTLAHRDAMSAFKARFSTDEDFKKMVQTKIKEIQENHEKWLASKLDSVCNSTPEDIRATFPGIFDQYLVDLNDDDRAVANYYLCKEPFYYDPENFDSDCDGENDADDPAPGDPFIPESERSSDSEVLRDPPFSSSTTDTEVKLRENDPNIIDVSTEISFGFDDNITIEEKVLYFKFILNCTAELKQSLEEKAKQWSKGRAAFANKTINFDFKITQAGSFEADDFTVHRCWCSICRVRTDIGAIYDSYIPKDKCRADFTEEEVKAMGDSTLNPWRSIPPENNWFNNADAGNLIVSERDPEYSCRTIKHELMHKLGLPDEYSADWYPFNLIGERDSLLSTGDKIYDRHIGSILSPKECTMKDGNRML